MMPRSARFDREVARSGHEPVSEVVLKAPTGETVWRFAIIGGAVTYTVQSGTITSSLNVTVADIADELAITEDHILRGWIYGKDGDTYGDMGGTFGSYSQTVQTGVLVPYGNELHVARGFRYRDGTTELIPLGVFPLDTVSFEYSATSRQIRLTGKDRSIILSRNKWISPLTVLPATNYATAISAVLTSRLGEYWEPRITRTLDSLATVTPGVTFGASPGGDGWRDACGMARVNNKQLYFDRSGNIRMNTARDPVGATPDLVLSDGEGGTVIKVTRLYSREKTYNGFVVSGENSSGAEPVRGEAFDTLASSPTRRQGPFGYAPKMIVTPLVTDPAMAQAFANQLYTENLALYEELRFDFIPNAALEVTDILGASIPSAGIGHTYAIRSLTVPLDLGLSTATVQRRLLEGDS
jgi:hypothetical protein